MNGIPVIRTDKRLKPCPYCGNKNPIINQMDLHLFEVSCSIYACNIPMSILAFDEKDAIDSWNHMVDDTCMRVKKEKYE